MLFTSDGGVPQSPQQAKSPATPNGGEHFDPSEYRDLFPPCEVTAPEPTPAAPEPVAPAAAPLASPKPIEQAVLVEANSPRGRVAMALPAP
jgi:hypothetical protein